ncbi:MAG TPA: enoyl-CoA hydratase/isomerase family protein, partial [Acidimicrobiales bacterium]
MSAFLRTERPADGVVVVTLDRPDRRNALSTALRQEGNALLAELADDASIRALVVTGAGPAFCAGFDLGEFGPALEDPALAEALWASSDEWHQRWFTFPVPTIAAVNGPALAGGFDLAVLCDLRVAGPTATFAHPEVRFGDVVYGPLHDLVGGAVARELCFTARTIDAQEAHRLGVVGQVVDD